jgi:O-antigen/teichoic acid export membrane protein
MHEASGPKFPGAFLRRLAMLRISGFQLSLPKGPQDQTTATGRGNERVRRLAWTSAASGVAKATGMLGPLVTIPLTLHYLGSERYALWMALSATLGMLSFADLGLGGEIMTSVAQATGKQDRNMARSAISSAFLMLALVGLVLAVSGAAASNSLPWERLLNVTDPNVSQECAPVGLAILLTIAINIPLGLVARVQLALQEGFYSGLWQAAGNLGSIVAVVLAVWLKLSLVGLVFAMSLPPILAALGNGAALFSKQHPELCPCVSAFRLPVAVALLRQGVQFFLITILTTVNLQADPIIISHALGLSYVTDYSVPARLASIVIAVGAIIYTPLWTANAEALARGDHHWVYLNTQRVLVLSVLLTASMGVTFVAAAPSLIPYWLGTTIQMPLGLITGLAVWATLMAGSGPLFMVLNGAGKLKPQITMFLIYLPPTCLLKYVGGKMFGLGGVVWAGILCYGAIILPLLWKSVREEFAIQSSRGAIRQ